MFVCVIAYFLSGAQAKLITFSKVAVDSFCGYDESLVHI